MQIRRLNSLIDQKIGMFHNENESIVLSKYKGMLKLAEVTPSKKINIIKNRPKDADKLRLLINQLNNLKIKGILAEIMEGDDEAEEITERFYINKEYNLIKFKIPKSEVDCAVWDLSGKLLPCFKVHFNTPDEAIQFVIRDVQRGLIMINSYISKMKEGLIIKEKNKESLEKALEKLKNNLYATYDL